MKQEDVLVLLVVFVLGFVVSQMMSGRLVESFDIENVWDDVKGHAKSFGDDFKAGADPVVKWTSDVYDHSGADEVNPFTPNPDVEGKKACKSSIDCLDVCGRAITFREAECNDGKCHCGHLQDHIMGFM